MENLVQAYVCICVNLFKCQYLVDIFKVYVKNLSLNIEVKILEILSNSFNYLKMIIQAN